MTRYLISGDSNGLSDPYCKITIDGETKQTSIKYKCVNGIWNEKLIFDTVSFNYKEKATWPVMLITVMDKDINSSDMLGYSYLWLNDTNYSYNELKRIKPKWEQLYLKKSNRAQGQILLSFIILDNEHRNIIKNINIEPETIPYNVEINALGLRDLKPLTFIKIKKPFISFENDTGKNPNINSVIKFNVKLPKDEIFIPEFQCDVYDYVLAGLSKRILGIFLIDLRQIIRETKRHYQEEYEEAEKVMKILQDKEIQRQSINTKININEINGINTSKENINNDLIDTMIQKPQIKKNKDNNLFLCYYPSDLKKIYKGKINNDILEREKHNSEYFVLKPSFKKCVLPNKLRKKLEKINNLENNELDEDYLIEDSENIPNLELYFPLGFNKNENPFKLKDKSKTDINLINNDDEEKEIFINNKENEFNNNNNKKHYRRIYRKELENVKELNLGAPFIKCHLLRNKYEDTPNSLNDLLEAIKDEKNKIIKRFKHKVSEKNGKLRAINNLRMNYIETDEELMRSKELIFDLRNYGYFKGLIRISPKSLYDEHMNYIQSIKDKYKGNLPSELSFLTAFDELGKNIIIKRNIIVRIYILELNNLSRRDLFSESDPYIKILLGDKLLINEQKKALKNQRNCKWYKSYDIKLQLPGSSKLRIQAMDYDTLFSDDLIGETSIDIEDRYFDNRWQSLVNKPIEVRQLYHPDYDKSQGEVMLWIDMFSQNEEYKMEKWNIEPEPKNKMEMRLIIYETEGMENLDIEDISDIYVMAFIDEKNKGQTDIHYRCSTGKASFNWRMIIPIDIPRDKYNLTIQVFDNDIFSKDDYICGGTINIYQILNDANILDIPLQLNEDYYSCLPKEQQRMSNVIFAEKEEEEDSYKFWVQLEKQGKKGGRVLCSLEIVPQWYAELHPVGKGRDEPNMNPYLPPPIGRIKFTWNPFKILNQLTGPKFRKKCYCIVCFACLLIYLIFLIPYLVYFISGEVINPFNY